MPEWPEINNEKSYAEATSFHKKISSVDFGNTKVLAVEERKLKDALTGHQFTKAQQYGKYLLLKISADGWMVFHFGMSGRLEFVKGEELPKHAHVIITFKKTEHLLFVCPRMFGRVDLVEDIDELIKKHDLGPDVMSLTEGGFKNLLAEKTGSIKVVLTNQHLISGLGNTYADEALFQAGIHPKTEVSAINEKGLSQLYMQVGKVLKTVVSHFSGHDTQENLPETYLVNHRKDGAACPKCSGKVKKITLGGRSTYFCPACQTQQSS